MADDNNRREQDKLINVTRPKANSAPRSNIDASRVSSYTMQEAQSLEKLKKAVGGGQDNRGKHSKIKSIIAIILVLLLIMLLVVFIIVLSRTGTSEEETYDMRVSMEIENKSLLTMITESGQQALRPINPGDVLDLSAYARNSNEYTGDTNSGSGIPPNIYVRFKIRFILNYEDRYDVFTPTITANWYKFDPAVDSGDGKYDDHYYYFCGSVAYGRRVELFSRLKVNGAALTCEDADRGRYGQIQVSVDAIVADINQVSVQWSTAPNEWLLKTIRGDYNTNSVVGGE